MTQESNVTDAEIEAVFKGTNFGRTDYRVLLQQSVFKRLVDYHCGHTITMIMRELKLTGKTDKVTRRGKIFLRHAVPTYLISGG